SLIDTPTTALYTLSLHDALPISALPETWIYILSIKPSKARWNEWPKMKAANSLIRDFAGTQQRVQYIDVAADMFDAQGKLRADLFAEDGLHPNAKCYALWTSIIKPVLMKRFGPAKKVGQLRTEHRMASWRWQPMKCDMKK